MTCNECERIQKENLEGKNLAYLRIGKSNVLIGACDQHFNELRAMIGLKKRVVVRLNQKE